MDLCKKTHGLVKKSDDDGLSLHAVSDSCENFPGQILILLPPQNRNRMRTTSPDGRVEPESPNRLESRENMKTREPKWAEKIEKRRKNLKGQPVTDQSKLAMPLNHLTTSPADMISCLE